MKRKILTAILAATMAVGLAGCGGGEPGPITMDDLALVDKSGETVLYYRMPRKDAEDYIGLPDNVSSDLTDLWELQDYGDTKIAYNTSYDYDYYKDHKQEAYDLSTIETIITTGARFSTVRGVKVGDSVKDVTKAYGLPVYLWGAQVAAEDVDEQDTLLYSVKEEGEYAIAIQFSIEDGKVAEIDLSGRSNDKYLE